MKPQGKTSALKGLSPRRTFEAAVETGWRKTTIDPFTLRLAFSERVSHDNRGGSVEVAHYGGGSETWTCRELREHHKAKVWVLKPKYEHWAGLPIYDYDDDRVFIGLALPIEWTDFFDPRGAEISEEYGADRRRGAQQLGHGAPNIDPLREMHAYVKALPPETEAPTGAHVTASEQVAAAVKQLSETPADKKRRLNMERDRQEAASEDRRAVRRATAEKLGLSSHTYAADLRGYAGVADLRDLSGRGLIDLLTRWERRGLDVTAFTAARREITPAQLRLLQVAWRHVEMPEHRYHGMIQDYGGVVSAADLDRRGFDLCMAFLEAEGFDRTPIAPAAPAFGRRPGFASLEQVNLIRTLWCEWAGPTSESDATVEASLNAWLERYHRASSLRFVTTGAAGKIITALRAMKTRKLAVGREAS